MNFPGISNVHYEFVGDDSRVSLFFHPECRIGVKSLSNCCVILSNDSEEHPRIQAILKVANDVFPNAFEFCWSPYGNEGPKRTVYEGNVDLYPSRLSDYESIRAERKAKDRERMKAEREEILEYLHKKDVISALEFLNDCD